MDRAAIVSMLDRRGVTYGLVEHPPAQTTLEADAFIEGHEGVRTKTLFLVNRKRTRSYLVVMDDRKALDLSALAQVLGEGRLSFGSADRLRDALDLEPGVVSPLGLLSPAHRGTLLSFDRDMLSERVLTFHPGDNRATIFIATADLLDLLDAEGVEYQVIDC
ncbi:YbaK/EbsC family protein [Mobilicoccus sp.]|uniref:prolyl-tRNA synthetase associated domain-containing protein n=1 Tax=Mobilicoccus sp. TaxID=2034349 RepID=UPI002898BC31|nr:YbaK/EbsC family protein [Mobilicoccus sp.]